VKATPGAGPAAAVFEHHGLHSNRGAAQVIKSSEAEHQRNNEIADEVIDLPAKP
jgi:hypothetical protein